MNKDELLNKLYKLKRFEVGVGVLDYMSKTAVKFNHVLALVEQLDEPEKVVIPQFVADEFDYEKRTCYQVDESKDIPLILKCAFENPGIDDFLDWVRENPEDYIMAVGNGYEVEKEKLYLVSSEENSSGFWFLSKDNDGEIVIGTNEDYFKAGWKESKLTEKEIKDYDDRYWAFAKPEEETP